MSVSTATFGAMSACRTLSTTASPVFSRAAWTWPIDPEAMATSSNSSNSASIGCPKFLLDQLAGHLRRVGGRAFLEILQFLGQPDADQVRAGAEHLAKLDRRRAEFLNRQPQTNFPRVTGDRLALTRLEEVLGEIGAKETDPVRQPVLAQYGENLPPAVEIPGNLRN